MILAFALWLMSASADMTVRFDPGGPLAARLFQIETLHDTPVRIAGLCASACTLYLGLPQVCVTPSAVLIFHGPRNLTGQPLDPVRFDIWSEIMAQNYPAPLDAWFMAVGRFGEYRFKGQVLIDVGVQKC